MFVYTVAVFDFKSGVRSCDCDYQRPNHKNHQCRGICTDDDRDTLTQGGCTDTRTADLVFCAARNAQSMVHNKPTKPMSLQCGPIGNQVYTNRQYLTYFSVKSIRNVKDAFANILFVQMRLVNKHDQNYSKCYY